MSEAKHTHTPGPWVSNPRGDMVEQGEGAFDDERDFAKLIAHVERKCDARLIAAAPELLAAGAALIAALDHSLDIGERDFGKQRVALEEAIAKARGGT